MARIVVEISDYNGRGRSYGVYCPACKHAHIYDSRWTFNGNFEKPTFTPSMVEWCSHPETKEDLSRCHTFLTDGVWNFLSDCKHDMKDSKHPVVPFPESYNI